jgi:uncharacterized protein YceK
MTKNKLIYFLLTGFILLATFASMTGCGSIASSATIKVSGAWDLYYLTTVINDHYSLKPGVPAVDMIPSTSSIKDLKDGKVDAVIAGREFSSDELAGLSDNVIAYDAICVIIDENSYVGGRYANARKTSGLRQINSEALKEMLTAGQFTWEGEYYTRAALDPNSWLATTDLGWIQEPKTISYFYCLIPGKYDTQTVLFQNLGLNEAEITSGWNTFTSPKLSVEEEVLSFEYQPGAPYSAGTADFPFKIGLASRRVMLVAPKHVPVRALSIDGIDPIENTQSIYNGTYPLSRKIHLLTRDTASLKTAELVNFLKSDEGQQLITEAGYLPISPVK